MTNFYEGDVELTDGARLALDEYLASTRDQILASASRSAARTGTVGVREIMDAAEETLSPGRRGSSPLSRTDALLRAYQSVGGIGVVAGAAVFIIPDLREFSEQQLFGLLLSITGLLIAALVPILRASLVARQSRAPSSLVNRYQFDLGSRPRITEADILTLFRELELALRARLADSLGESRGASSLSQLVTSAQSVGILERQDYEEFRSVLTVRNKVAHMKDVSQEEITNAAEAATRMLARLRNG